MNNQLDSAHRNHDTRTEQTARAAYRRALQCGAFAAVAIAFSLLFVPASPAFPAAAAQMAGPYGGQRNGRRWQHGNELDYLSKALNLTGRQKLQIKPILENEHNSMKALWQNRSLTKEERHSKFMALHKETMEKIRPILSSEQQAKLQQMEQRREERMKQWHEHHAGNGSPAAAPQN